MSKDKELDFGMNCIKYMLCVANLMFVIVGLLLLSIGFTIRAIYSSFDEFMDSYYYHPSTLAIVSGFFIFGLAAFGCIGAWKQSTFLVNTFAFILTLILIMEIAVTIAAYAMRSTIEQSLTDNMRFSMDTFNFEYHEYAWNSTQSNLQCCGINNYTDWSLYSYRTDFNLVEMSIDDNSTIRIPATCCADENCSSSTLYTQGCLPRVSFIISQCAVLLAVGALCVSFIQILGIVFATMLAKSIRKLKTQKLVEREERRRNFYENMIKNQEIMNQKLPELYTPKDSEA